MLLCGESRSLIEAPYGLGLASAVFWLLCGESRSLIEAECNGNPYGAGTQGCSAVKAAASLKLGRRRLQRSIRRGCSAVKAAASLKRLVSGRVATGELPVALR